MDLARLSCILVVTPLVTINQIPPQLAHELRSDVDAVADGGAAHTYFISAVTTCVALYALTLFHLASFWAIPLGPSEYVLTAGALAGFALRMWSYHALGRSFTFTLGVRRGQTLVRDGPYAWMVHPSYTGQIVTLASSLLLLASWELAPLVLSIALGAITARMGARRASVEEKALGVHFGEEYRRYVHSRGRFFPVSLKRGE